MNIKRLGYENNRFNDWGLGRMKIGIIDVDSKNFPNLALMKLSAYHKSCGDTVGWYMPFNGHYDKVYISKVFSFSQDYDYVIDADEVVRGGSGYCISLNRGREIFDKSKDQELPYEIEHIYPDYSLYPLKTQDTAYGFLSRGCPRHCEFCIVSKKEGTISYKVADLNEFWRGQSKIVLCDPNILACKEWKDLLTQLIFSRAEIDFNQGLDVRMMNEEKIEYLKQLKISQIHFSWDRYEDKEKILPKLSLFAEKWGKRLMHNAIVYTIVNYDTTIKQDLERIYTLREMGYWPYVMIYDKEHCDSIYKKLQRWVNNRFIFAVCPTFNDYKTN